MNPWLGTAPQKRPDPQQYLQANDEFLGLLGSLALMGQETTRTIAAVLGLAAGIALLAASGPARAQSGSDGASDSTGFYKATVGRLLESFGFRSSDDTPEIKYQERAPLVLPASRDLPPPEKDAAVPNPAWPKDPDVKRRKLEEKQAKNRIETDYREQREQNPLRPDELAPGPRPRNMPNPDADRARDGTKLLSPSELGYKGGLLGKMFHGKSDEVAQFTGEPPRTDLTEPPPGYQTPSPNQPYGVVGGATPGKAYNDYLHRGEVQR